MVRPAESRETGQLRVRAARPGDARFLAVAIQAADRGHTGLGCWDVVLPGSDEDAVESLAALTTASQPSFVHWSTFLVAEIGGHAVGTVAGYAPGSLTPEHFAAAYREVVGGTIEPASGEGGGWTGDYFAVTLPDDTLRLEWVHTVPEARGQGVSSRLIATLLGKSRDDGFRTSHVSAYIGNDGAISLYRRAGYAEFAECRHQDYEEQFGTPGQVFLRRHL